MAKIKVAVYEFADHKTGEVFVGLENSDNVEGLYWMPLPELPMKYWIPSEETE